MNFFKNYVCLCILSMNANGYMHKKKKQIFHVVMRWRDICFSNLLPMFMTFVESHLERERERLNRKEKGRDDVFCSGSTVKYAFDLCHDIIVTVNYPSSFCLLQIFHVPNASHSTLVKEEVNKRVSIYLWEIGFPVGKMETGYEH